MMRKNVVAAGLAAAALLFVSGPAWGQGAGLPPPAEIEKRIQEELDKVPPKTIEYEGLAKLTYKPIPTDPAEIVKNNPALAGQLPPGLNLDSLAKQYGPMVQQYLNKYLADIGKLEVLEDLKYRSKKLPKGEYVLGLEFSGTDIIGAVISGEKLKKPIAVRFKSTSVAVPVKELAIELEKDEKLAKKDQEGFRIIAAMAKSKGGSAYPFEKD